MLSSAFGNWPRFLSAVTFCFIAGPPALGAVFVAASPDFGRETFWTSPVVVSVISLSGLLRGVAVDSFGEESESRFPAESTDQVGRESKGDVAQDRTFFADTVPFFTFF